MRVHELKIADRFLDVGENIISLATEKYQPSTSLTSQAKLLYHHKLLHRNVTMKNLQIRLPGDELREVEKLTKAMHMSKSEVARNALHEGLKSLKMSIAAKKYVDDEFTLCKAAEFAGVSIQEMSEYMGRREIPFFKYSTEELERDVKRAKKLLR